jgi:hypothetical protein
VLASLDDIGGVDGSLDDADDLGIAEPEQRRPA